jgi:translation initiation factor IF-2
VIVAVVGDAIRQTRCTTCDAEHVYKDGKEPRRKRKDTPTEVVPVPAEAASAPPAPPAPAAQLVQPRAAAAPDAADRTDRQEPAPPPEMHANGSNEVREEDVWPTHRPLIRATLPRTDADPPIPRPIPEFTMHQRAGHSFRQSGGWSQYGGGGGNGNANGNMPRHGGGGGRSGRPAPSQPGSNGHAGGPGGPGGGKPGRHRGGRNRRSR